MIDFIQDDDRLREERKKAKKNKDKYVGVSCDAMGGFRSSGSRSSSGWGNEAGWGSGISGGGRSSGGGGVTGGGFQDQLSDDDGPHSSPGTSSALSLLQIKSFGVGCYACCSS